MQISEKQNFSQDEHHQMCKVWFQIKYVCCTLKASRASKH